MKKLIFLFCLLPFLAQSQIYLKPNNGWGAIFNRGSFDSTLAPPTACGVPTDSTWLFSYGFTGAGQKLHKAALYYDSCGHRFYVWDPSLLAWHRVDSSAGAFAGLTDVSVTSPVNGDEVYFDSVSAKWKNNPWKEYNVTEWGIHPDSTDIRAKLIALRDHILNTSGAGTIYFPAGKMPYYLSDSVLFTHSIHLKGDGASGPLNNFQSGGTTPANRLGPVQYSTKIAVLNGKNGIVGDSAADGSKPMVEIEGITFESTIPPGSTNTSTFVVLRGMLQGPFIHNCTFYGGYIGIDKQSAYYSVFAYNHFSAQRKAFAKYNNVVRDDTGDDLFIGNTANSGTFVPAAGDTCVGLWWQSGGGFKGVGNKIDAAQFDTSTAYYWQILVENVLDPTSDFIWDISNSCEDWRASAIKMRGIVAPYVRNIQISGQFAGVGTSGPAIDIDHMSNIGIYAFNIRDWSGPVGAPAIRVTNSTDVTIGKGDIKSGSYTSNFDLTGSTTTHIDYMFGGDMAVGSLNTTNIGGLNSSLYTTQTILGRSTSGTNGSGVLELADQLPDAAGKDVGYINFSTSTNSVAKRAAIIGAVTNGGTANNRGGELDFYTNTNGSIITKQFSIGSAGSLFANGLNDGTGIPKMVTSNNGVLGYQAIPSGGGSGSPGGSNQNVQVNSGGTFYGNNAFNWDTTNLRLTIGTGTVTYPSDLNISRSTNGFMGISLQNTNTGSLSRVENLIVEDATHYASFGGRWPSTATSNWAGTSISQAENVYQYTFSGSALGNKPIVLNATPVFILPGSTGTNVGFRQDATGLRIGAISGLHTSNTYPLEVQGESKFASSSTSAATMNLGAGTGTAPTSHIAGDFYPTSGGLFYDDGTTAHNLLFGKIWAQTANGTAITNTTTLSQLTGSGTGSTIIYGPIGLTWVWHGYFYLSTAASSPGNLLLSFGTSHTISPPTGLSAQLCEVYAYGTVTSITVGSSASFSEVMTLNIPGNPVIINTQTGTFTGSVTNPLNVNIQQPTAAWSIASSSNSIQSVPVFTLKIE